jgi:hypothetical protein
MAPKFRVSCLAEAEVLLAGAGAGAAAEGAGAGAGAAADGAGAGAAAEDAGAAGLAAEEVVGEPHPIITRLRMMTIDKATRRNIDSFLFFIFTSLLFLTINSDIKMKKR